MINKQLTNDIIFSYSDLVTSREVYLKSARILKSWRAKNKVVSRGLFGVLACKKHTFFTSSDRHCNQVRWSNEMGEN
jgi:hypothetical protein